MVESFEVLRDGFRRRVHGATAAAFPRPDLTPWLFQIIVVLGAVLGTIIYRISLVSVIYGGGGFFLKKHAKIFTSMTAALINLTIIMILTRVTLNAILPDG